MDESKLIQALGSALGGGVVSGALLLILYKVFSRIAERMIAAIDRIAANVTEHTTKDLEHHAEVREAVVRVETKLDSALDRPTRPQRAQRTRTQPNGIRSPRGEPDDD